ncbi:MAG: hypothetical protein QGG69_04875, partial [Kiritimatiellia bacterium]|nr:hypothetical protein [Kiritimatiellia bacterium]
GLMLFLYNLLPHFEIFDLRMRILHSYGAVPVTTFLMVIAYGLLVTAIFLVLAWSAYRGKHFARGSLSGY